MTSREKRTKGSKPVRCDDVSILLAGAVDGTSTLTPAAQAHFETCLRCQAEMVQYRKLLRVMKTMRGELLNPGEDLLTDVLELVRPPATVHRLHRADRRRAYIGGIAAAATAGAAGAIVFASKLGHRPRLAS